MELRGPHYKQNDNLWFHDGELYTYTIQELKGAPRLPSGVG